MKMFFLSLSFFYVFSAFALDQNPHAKVSLQSFSNEGQNYLAAVYKNDEHWHTYWKNPGDAGTAIEVTFTLNGQAFNPEALEWPIPQIFMEPGDMQAFGYEGEYALFFKLSDADLKNAEGKNLEFNTKWLICENQCIWGQETYKGKMKGKEFMPNAPLPFTWTNDQLTKALKDLPAELEWPKELNYKLYLAPDKENLIARYEYKSPNNLTLPKGKNLLIPFADGPMIYRHEALNYTEGQIIGTIPTKWEGAYREPEYLLPKDGKFPTPLEQKFIFFNPANGKSSVIKKNLSSFELTPPASLETPKAPIENRSIFIYLLLAFIGGLILNLMPCVFPVISLKLFGLIKKRDDAPEKILVHNLMYTLGVLLSFLTLALIIILLKRGGEEIGWGFQLQSPLFVSGMIIFLFIFVINLFGLFEFITPGGNTLGNLRFNKGHLSHIMEGVIATVLSTPCSAPFLGTALTFAFSSSPLTIILIFLMIGLGLSLPFILVGFFPQTIRFFPRPGYWMGHLRKFLGLTLILTIIWLMGVLLAQTDNILTFQYLLLTLTLIFFSIFFSIKISPLLRWRAIFVVLIILSASALVSSTLSGPSSSLELQWKKWSLEEMSNHEKITFVDFTADWCLTCKVNEAVVLKTDDFTELVKKYDLRLLLADWTKKDPKIAEFLTQHGSSAVPAYFIQDKDGNLHPLGETISIEKIEKVLQEAEKK